MPLAELLLLLLQLRRPPSQQLRQGLGQGLCQELPRLLLRRPRLPNPHPHSSRNGVWRGPLLQQLHSPLDLLLH